MNQLGKKNKWQCEKKNIAFCTRDEDWVSMVQVF